MSTLVDDIPRGPIHGRAGGAGALMGLVLLLALPFLSGPVLADDMTAPGADKAEALAPGALDDVAPEATPAPSPAETDLAPEPEPQLDTMPAEPVDPAAFLDQAYLTCVSALADPQGAYDIFEAAEWAPVSDVATESAYFRSIDGAKIFAGIGEASLFYSIEVFPSRTIHYCIITIDGAETAIPIATMLGRTDLRGAIRRENGRIFSIWEDDADEPSLFIQVEQDETDGDFTLDATHNQDVPASDLPALILGEGGDD
ncbi:MAG: hypothetical protein KKH72_00945 [Alphaproteobacteria bacterium]|nr:hypothetical protein [Alphaproteobacteria bacterium]